MVLGISQILVIGWWSAIILIILCYTLSVGCGALVDMGLKIAR